MAENPIPPIPVRTALMPAYYKDFHCIMGACQDDCCDVGWKIEFSKKDYLTIKRAVQSEALKDMVAQGMSRLRERAHDDLFAEFHVSEEGRCAFHTDEGLCALQLECGESVLPWVCRSFPRQNLYTPAAKELSMSPACEGVLALLWDLPQGIDFLEGPLEKRDWKEIRPANPIHARFADIRSLCIDILQERSLTMGQRMLTLGILLQKLRDGDWTQGETVDEWIHQGEAILHSPSINEVLDGMPGNKSMFLLHCYRVMLSLMIGARHGKSLFQELWISIQAGQKAGETTQLVFNVKRYEELETRLADLLGNSEYFWENLMVAIAFHLHAPVLLSPEELWKSYVDFCNVYSLFRFTAVCAMEKEASRERLFHALVELSRAVLHSNGFQTSLRDQFFQNDSATLAHMAILVGG